MTEKMKINNSILRVTKDDITMLDVDCFVYYAQSNLKLGSGFGGAITLRGGQSIQKELDSMDPINVTQAVITEAGNLKAKRIIHANGPKFQEEDLERKLTDTILNVLKLADKEGLETIAFPPMGTGFYGIPLDVSASVTLNTIKDYLNGQTGIKEVTLSVIDRREYEPYHNRLLALS